MISFKNTIFHGGKLFLVFVRIESRRSGKQAKVLTLSQGCGHSSLPVSVQPSRQD